MTKDFFHTIKTEVKDVLFKEKNSKFYGFAFPIKTQEDVKKHLLEVKNLHPQAGHYCFAWQLGVEEISYRVSDDGEPSHSAGMPIYGQIRAAQITNTLIIIVRYFGGIKLGVGGLIKAYRTTAQDTIEAGTIVKKKRVKTLQIKFPYETLNNVMRILKEENLEVITLKQTEDCLLTTTIILSKYMRIKSRFTALHKLEVIAS